MRTLFILFVIGLLGTPFLQAQTAPNKYWVEFTDKNDSPYSVDNPIEFLSQKSIDRRTTQNIDVIEQDIPVNQTYINGVLALGDIDLLLRSKWLNAITVFLTDESLLDEITALDYVVQIKSANKYKKKCIKQKKSRHIQKNLIPKITVPLLINWKC